MNLTRQRMLHPRIIKVGYYELRYGSRVNLQREYIHRLVAVEFVPNPKGYNVVNHIDGCKTNNRSENLEWVEHNENMRHVAMNGFIKNQRSKKLSSDEVYDIRTLALYGFKAAELAISFKVHENTIRKIINQEDWRHEPMPERSCCERSI